MLEILHASKLKTNQNCFNKSWKKDYFDFRKFSKWNFCKEFSYDIIIYKKQIMPRFVPKQFLIKLTGLPNKYETSKTTL